MDAGQEEADKLLARVSKLVVKPRDKALHGEKVTLKKVGDGSLVEVTVSTKKPVGKAYFQLRDKSTPLPGIVASYWREDGLAVAVEASDERDPEADGYGPPSFVVVIPLDGSAANAPRPQTPRDESRALNIAGMKLLKAGSLDAAQKKFVEATEADDTYSIAMYLTLAAKNKSTIRIAWEVFSDGFFDADAFVDDKPVRLQKLASIATISKKISSK